MAWGGYLGKQYDPFLGNQASSLFKLPRGLDQDRISSRQSLQQQFDRLRRDLDLVGLDGRHGPLRAAGRRHRGRPPGASTCSICRKSPPPSASATATTTGASKPCSARRLVEAGVSFVTIDLSNHGSSGTWDTHGDNIPPYGGIWNGLRPLLPVFDHLLTTLVADLDERGLLDDVLVIAMGEFGRTPKIGTQGSTDGRDHWPVVMSMTLAGGGLRHGQVIGSTRARRRTDQGAARHARRPGRHDLSPHGRAAGRHVSRRPRPAALLRRARRTDSRVDLSSRLTP